MELMRLLIRRVDLIWRQMVAFRGGDPPDAIEVRLPGEKPPPKKSLRSVAAQAMQNMRRG